MKKKERFFVLKIIKKICKENNYKITDNRIITRIYASHISKDRFMVIETNGKRKKIWLNLHSWTEKIKCSYRFDGELTMAYAYFYELENENDIEKQIEKFLGE